MNIQRYTNYKLPEWKYIPGYNTHPSKMPKVRHVPKLPVNLLNFSSLNWEKSERYLYAIDLFNKQYYWEVHEVLEKLWIETGKHTQEGIFLKGIIQLSVALLKKIQNNSNGVLRLTEKAIPKINSQSGVYLGIDINDFIERYYLFVNEETDIEPIIYLQINNLDLSVSLV